MQHRFYLTYAMLPAATCLLALATVYRLYSCVELCNLLKLLAGSLMTLLADQYTLTFNACIPQSLSVTLFETAPSALSLHVLYFLARSQENVDKMYKAFALMASADVNGSLLMQAKD